MKETLIEEELELRLEKIEGQKSRIRKEGRTNRNNED